MPAIRDALKASFLAVICIILFNKKGGRSPMLITYNWPTGNDPDEIESVTFKSEVESPKNGDFVSLSFESSDGEHVEKSGWVLNRIWSHRQGEESELTVFLGDSKGRQG
jgi:hypothetical protein